MTTFEKKRALDQIVQNIEGLRADIRANAAAYKDSLTRGAPFASVLSVVRQDASEYQRRLGWIASIPSAARAELVAFATARGLDASEITTEYQTLKAVADDQATAQIATAAQLTAKADSILANTPEHFSLW